MGERVPEHRKVVRNANGDKVVLFPCRDDKEADSSMWPESDRGEMKRSALIDRYETEDGRVATALDELGNFLIDDVQFTEIDPENL